MEQAIFARLTSHAGTAALVGSRVYPLIAPQNPVKPYVTYTHISGYRVRSLNGPSGMGHPRFQIDCWALSFSAALGLATQVRFALDGWRGLAAGVRVGSGILDSETHFYESDTGLYRVSLDFVFLHDEATQ